MDTGIDLSEAPQVLLGGSFLTGAFLVFVRVLKEYAAARKENNEIADKWRNYAEELEERLRKEEATKGKNRRIADKSPKVKDGPEES